MSINDDMGWSEVERRAQQHELGQGDLDAIEVIGQDYERDLRHVETMKVPEPPPPPTIEQQLLWATIELAKTKSTLHRNKSAIAEAIMYNSLGQSDRVQQILNRALLGL